MGITPIDAANARCGLLRLLTGTRGTGLREAWRSADGTSPGVPPPRRRAGQGPRNRSRRRADERARYRARGVATRRDSHHRRALGQRHAIATTTMVGRPVRCGLGVRAHGCGMDIQAGTATPPCGRSRGRYPLILTRMITDLRLWLQVWCFLARWYPDYPAVRAGSQGGC